MGCVIRVGPALGVTSAFVFDDDADLEPGLLLPWVDSSEVQEGRVAWRGRFVVSLFDKDGVLLDLREFPRLARQLVRHRDDLEARYIVRRGAPWYRTIDRLRAADWQRPKILVPEIAKKPRVALGPHGVRSVARRLRDLSAGRRHRDDLRGAARWGPRSGT